MYFTDLRIKIIEFIRKHKYKIYIGLIILTVIIAVNMILGKVKDSQPPSSIYDAHNPIVSGSKVSSKKQQNKIESTIKEYMDFCKSKDYESAYNCLSNNCKEYKFKNKLENFKSYIDAIFDGNKVYSIQDYSNKDNIYIYQVSIFEDIMASGMNNKDSEHTEEEKIVLTKNGDNYDLAVSGLIKVEDEDAVAEDDYMKISVQKKITYYDKIVYKIKVKNKTNNIIILDKNNEKNYIGISLREEYRNEIKNIYANNEKVLRGGQTKEFDLEFPVYFDEEKQPTAIVLNKICILEKYTGIEDNWEKELENAIKAYSLKIDL